MSALAMLADTSRHVATAHIIANSSLPPSYNGDRLLAAGNLLLMLAGTYMATATWVSEALDIWRYRRVDRWNHPITAQRVMLVFCGLAASIRCGAEAATVLGWDPRDPSTGAVLLNLKHYLDPVAISCLFGWMAVRVMTKRAVNAQLRRDPIETKMWATVPQLVQPAIVVMLSAIMSFGAIYLRGR